LRLQIEDKNTHRGANQICPPDG